MIQSLPSGSRQYVSNHLTTDNPRISGLSTYPWSSSSRFWSGAGTVDIPAHHSVRTWLGETLLADATFRALRVARMQVRAHQFESVAHVIGNENVIRCSSLKRLARLRPVVLSG